MFLKNHRVKPRSLLICIFALLLISLCCSCTKSSNAEGVVEEYFAALGSLDFEGAQSCLTPQDSYDGLLKDLSSEDYITRLNADCFAKAVYQTLEARIISSSADGNRIEVEIKAVDSEELTTLAYESVSEALGEGSLSGMSEEEIRELLSEVFENAYKNASASAQRKQNTVILELIENENGELKIKATKELFDAISGRKIPDA